MKAIGVDIGGTKIAVAAIDAQGQFHSQVTFPTEPKRGFATALEKINSAIEETALKAGWSLDELCGIGVGCTGPVDPLRGTIHNPHTLPTWDDCDLVTPLRERFNVPVRMENDADVAVLGEFKFGAGLNANPIVMLTFGTGIGFAAIVAGQIYRGVDGAHPELGHIPTMPFSLNSVNCYCGIADCFESLASGTAIDNAGQAASFQSSREVFQAAKSGDSTATHIIDRALQATASATWTIAHTFLPERIILGGGIIDDHFDLFAAACRAAIAKAVMIPGDRIRVVQAALGAKAGVVGAAMLVMQPTSMQSGPSSKTDWQAPPTMSVNK